MDAASSGDAAGELPSDPGASPRPSRFQWLWAPLALGAAAALVNLSLASLMQTLRDPLVLNNSYWYTHQATLNAILVAVGDLTVPVIALIVAYSFTHRSPGGRRWDVRARFLGALALLLGVAWLHQVVSTALYRSLFGGQETPSILNYAVNVITMVSSGVNGFLLGVSLILAMRALAPHLAPRDRWPRLGYWMLAGVFGGSVVACVSQLDRFLLMTVIAARLAVLGVITCMADSGAACYGGQLLTLVQYSVLPLLAGAALGGVIGGLLAPDLASGRDQPGVSSPSEPATGADEQGRSSRGSWVVGALRYTAGGVIGAIYLAVALSLTYAVAFLVNSRSVSAPSAAREIQIDMWAVALIGASLLVPAGWLALCGQRVRLAGALSRGGKRTLRWALALLAVVLGLALPTTATFFQVAIAGYGLPLILLNAFSLGAAYGLLWAPQPRSARPRPAWRAGARSAATGWLGGSLLIAILLGVGFYSAVIIGPPVNSCHGLGCGAIYFTIVDLVMTVGVHIIVFGLPAALFAGSLAGMIREALRAP